MLAAWTNDYGHIVRKESETCQIKPRAFAAEASLYLVLDDWDKGYNTYRVGEDDFVVVSDADDNCSLQDDDSRQAESPLVSIKALHVLRDTAPTWRLCVDVPFRLDKLHFGAKLRVHGGQQVLLGRVPAGGCRWRMTTTMAAFTGGRSADDPRAVGVMRPCGTKLTKVGMTQDPAAFWM